MPDRPKNVLFICTGNSARSIMAEAILGRTGAGRFRVYSAGSMPRGEVHPFTLALLERHGFSTEGLRSKGLDEVSGPDAPPQDFVFSVCDMLPSAFYTSFLGQPLTAHWNVPDPAAATGSEAVIAQAFNDAYRRLNHRISLFNSLPLASLDRLSLQGRLDRIGQVSDEAAPAP
jgi:arsenate reductase